ncbi:DNA primase [Commensalibacter sp. Nvir]|uniref:DNA primase n=1 Tax=Commensalibacter sp. Nvir TaxID=3069817 RepID=UPI002D6511A4|nr:DNA primase [Commensalibacter sp. Nvir]
MAFDQQFLDELRQRLPLQSIVSKKLKLIRSGRNWKACCPFHGEKTPSLYIYDDHYHCYGCQAHGDVISFYMETEGKNFNETIRELAALAGLEVPEQTLQQKQSQERNNVLYDVLTCAHRYYIELLRSNKANVVRNYLYQRGITDQTFAEFGLGWSGDGRGGLISHLKQNGYGLKEIGQAGLLRKINENEWGGELFFKRIMYPIMNRRGQIIAFGGRVMGDGQPKYLNSPETPLFVKRKMLFGFHRLSALNKSKDSDPLYHQVLVVEGYMDVIALHQAGFGGAVAPLGTALTQEQLTLLWRVTRQPLICFDGDDAGRRASLHAAEEALPLLTSNQTLGFVYLDNQEDPDSFIRKKGKEAFLEVLRNKLNLSDVLYELSLEAMVDNTPEQRAVLKSRLLSLSKTIKDSNLSQEYRKTLLDRFYQDFYSKTIQNKSKRQHSQTRHASRLVLSQHQVKYKRLCILLIILIYFPNIIQNVEEALCKLPLPKELAKIREIIIEMNGLCDNINDLIEKNGLTFLVQKIKEQADLPGLEQMKNVHDLHVIEKQWWHFYGWINIHELEEQVLHAQQAWLLHPDQENQQAYIARLNALEKLKCGEDDIFDEEF